MVYYTQYLSGITGSHVLQGYKIRKKNVKCSNYILKECSGTKNYLHLVLSNRKLF